MEPSDIRRLFLQAQGLIGAPEAGGVRSMLRRVGAVQLDTISVLARSHELVAYARLGAVGRTAIEQAYWGRPAAAFEYWAHAACVLPIEAWPSFEFRRRRRRLAKSRERTNLLARLRAQGPSTAAELGSTGRRGEWWDWHPVKIAVEELLRAGDVVCVERRGWRRVYDLVERAIPARLRAIAPDDASCAAALIASAAERLAVATPRELGDYYRLPSAMVRPAIEAAGLVAVGDQWAHPRLPRPKGGARPTLLSPFDPVVWHRARTKRLFELDYRLEAYVPAAKRVHGYFSMPLLVGDQLRGRVDPARDGATLIARRVSLSRQDVAPMASALHDAAGWVGCNNVVVEQVVPASLKKALVKAAGK